MQPKRLVIPFDMNMSLYESRYVNKNFHNYSELLKQVFDVMTPDLHTFNQSIETLPNLDNLIIDLETFDRNEMLLFKEKFKIHALSVYFTCFSFKLFIDNKFDFILESVGPDYFVLYDATEPTPV